MGIGCSVWSILTQFLSIQSLHIMVDGCLSKLVNFVSGVLQGSVLGMLLFFVFTSELFSILENKLIGYADDSTLMALCLPQALELKYQSPICDRGRVSEWCDLWGMKLNASKTKTKASKTKTPGHAQCIPSHPH